MDPAPALLTRSQHALKPPVHLSNQHSYHNSQHHHTATAGLAALAANAFFARNLTLQANAAFTRRQQWQWRPGSHQGHHDDLRRNLPQSTSPTPPGYPPTTVPEIDKTTINLGDVATAAVSTQNDSWGEQTRYGRRRAEG